MGWFLIKFCVLAIGVFWLHFQKEVYARVTEPWTELLASVCAKIIHLFDSETYSKGVEIYTTRLNDQDFSGVSIQAGCNAIEACLILFVAMIAFPAPITYKIKGMIYGFIAVQSVNILRIISLFYLGMWSKEIFDFAHYYAWQVLIIIDAFIVFLIWLSRLPDNDLPPTDTNNEDKISDSLDDDSSIHIANHT